MNDNHQPDFTFAHRDEGFDNHIEDSIRGYRNLHDDVVNLSQYFVENDPNKIVLDIGCSTGKTINAMMEQNHSFAPRARYVGVEYATGFIEDMQNSEVEITQKELGSVKFYNKDIRDFEFIETNCSLITSLFTLQFMPPSERVGILKKIYDSLVCGGAFIFSEKTVSSDSRIQDMINFTFYDHKRKSFEDKDILDKEKTLRHMLKPNTWTELVEMLNHAGFKSDKIQTFWQNHLFVAAIAMK